MITTKYRKPPLVLGMALIVIAVILNVLIFRQSDAQQFKPSTKIITGEPITYLVLQNHTKIAPTKDSNGGADINLIIKGLIRCESNGNSKAIGDNGKAKGILQFHQGTFDKFGSLYNLPHDNIWDSDQQITIAKRMIEDGLIFHWRNCAKSLSLLK